MQGKRLLLHPGSCAWLLYCTHHQCSADGVFEEDEVRRTGMKMEEWHVSALHAYAYYAVLIFVHTTGLRTQHSAHRPFRKLELGGYFDTVSP